MRFRFVDSVTVGVVLALGLATPAFGEPLRPTPLPRTGTPRAYPIEPRAYEINQRTSSMDGRRESTLTKDALQVVIESSVLFGKDSDVLQPEAGTELDRVARQITDQHTRRGSGSPAKLEVIGFTDDLGSEAHGLDLSKRRAARVADHLKGKIPDEIELEVIGKGEAEPRVPNDSEANRAKNRRVELRLS